MTLAFTANTKDFAAVLAANVLPAHTQQDIYHRLVLSADLDAGHICVLSSDGEMRLEVRGLCEPDESADRKGYGKCTVPGRLLSDISRYFGAEQVHVRQDGSELKITSGRSEFSIPAGDADDYPGWERPAPPFLQLDGDELAAAFRKVALAAGEFPVCLSGICLDIGDGELSLVTTDRNRMAVARLPYEVSGFTEDTRAILPAKAAEKLARSLEGRAGIGWNAGVMFMQYAGKEGSPVRGGEMMTRLIAEPYPDWRRILDKKPEGKGITCDTRDMIRAVRMAQLAAPAAPADKISWTFGDHEIAVRAVREGRECTEYVPSSHDAGDHAFLLGAQYVLDGLAGCDTTTEMTFTDEMAPLFFRSGSYAYMIQPRRELL